MNGEGLYVKLNGSSLITVNDDEDPFLDLTRDLFEGEGYRVVVGCVLDGALAVLRVTSPDLLILDLTIGAERVAGLTLLRTLRADPPFARLPIIVASAATDLLTTYPAEFARLNAVTLEKPFPLYQLVNLAAMLTSGIPLSGAHMGRVPAHADGKGGGG